MKLNLGSTRKKVIYNIQSVYIYKTIQTNFLFLMIYVVKNAKRKTENQ